MEEFNISSNKLQKLEALKELLQKGVEHIPELQAYLSKPVGGINLVHT